jgi:hypothetical protein
LITAPQPSRIFGGSGLNPRWFARLLTALRREGADGGRTGRP